MSAADVKCTCRCHTELERWERFQEAAGLEKSWMSERLNWMLVPQGVLFGALAWIVKLSNDPGSTPDIIGQLTTLAAMVSTLGATLALIGFVGALAAGRMHFLWTTEINKIAAKLIENDPSHPLVTFGMKPHWPARSSTVMPVFVAGAFFATWEIFIHRFFDAKITDNIEYVLIGETLLAVLIVWGLIRLGKRLQSSG